VFWDLAVSGIEKLEADLAYFEVATPAYQTLGRLPGRLAIVEALVENVFPLCFPILLDAEEDFFKEVGVFAARSRGREVDGCRVGGCGGIGRELGGSAL
jgi:hypothetical protein